MSSTESSSYREDAGLRARLQAFSPDEPGVAFSFSARLARENGWTPEHARRVTREYLRFVYLAMTAGHPVTPSAKVDEAWHLHLTYTRSYWEEMCGRVLGRPLHHEPTRGGTAEDAKFEDQYARTLASYRAAFGHEPPFDIWPRPAPKPRAVERPAPGPSLPGARRRGMYDAVPDASPAAASGLAALIAAAAGVLAILGGLSGSAAIFIAMVTVIVAYPIAIVVNNPLGPAPPHRPGKKPACSSGDCGAPLGSFADCGGGGGHAGCGGHSGCGHGSCGGHGCGSGCGSGGH
ncbi:hypothetical protein [Longimicrobium sp.]|uniref:glycine-rich domain-containing protein n=1 Tax=Longimicrobium sp. TaxID=2029185 RepID=UPI002B821558|nr:hypothetical protein [Longimicrobium sp.]HSU15174.1 hypothetical protein [Longimicrobium sp.]